MSKRNKPFRRAKQPTERQPASSAASTVDVQFQRASTLHHAGQLPQAEALYRQVLQMSPNHSDALHMLGVMAYQVGKPALALELIDKAIEANPRDAAYYNNRGNLLNVLGRHQEALESLDQAIVLKPDLAEAHCNRGNALKGLSRRQAAIDSYDRAIFLKPDLADAYYNRGNALLSLWQHQAALDSFDRAILLRPGFASAYCNRGNAFQNLRQYPAALESFEQSLQLKPDSEYLPGERWNVMQYLCEWGSEGDFQHLEAGIDRGERVCQPFIVLTTSSSPMLQRKSAEILVRDICSRTSASAAIPRRPRQKKIRVGYFSADYYNHATCYLLAELFERHDRNRFEVIGFSFGPEIVDEMSERVSTAMDRFFDVRSLTDRAVAQLSRDLGIDIAVDLKGFTKDHRGGIFAERAAPIQVNYLGYPGTTGADYMDYLIADATLIPEASQRYYSEKIVYLPGSYQVNDSKRSISAKPYSRAGEGLPEKSFVFCCFNNNYKITPDVFNRWMRVLGQVEESVLWLLEDNPWASENLRKEAGRRGISSERLIFAQRLPLAEHLARHSLADLFLDTFPCNAHTTTSDALWAGLPVLTRMGETFASRVAASLLNAIDLPELVTTTEAGYESMALELALNSERRHAIRTKLSQNRLTSPLFDIESYTKHLEAAYISMYERYQAGLAPDHIRIARHSDSPGCTDRRCCGGLVAAPTHANELGLP
jgi:predicted O-linked N-acetylglucosamine transferase (SPINDLY family)